MSLPQIDPDTELVAKLQKGDERAFRAIWDMYHGRLIQFAYRYMRSYDMAADVVQQVFFMLWRERESLAPQTTLVRHLYGSVRFRALRDLRHARVVRSYEAAVGAQYESDVPVAWNAGESTVVHDELVQAVNTALGNMTPRVREIFLLHREDGLTAAQIAAVLEIKLQVVYNQLSKALKVLAEATSDIRKA